MQRRRRSTGTAKSLSGLMQIKSHFSSSVAEVNECSRRQRPSLTGINQSISLTVKTCDHYTAVLRHLAGTVGTPMYQT